MPERAPVALPPIKAGVVIGGASHSPARSKPSELGPRPSKLEVVDHVARRLVQESRTVYNSYQAEAEDLQRTLSAQVQLVAEMRSERRKEQRQRKQRERAKIRPNNPFLNHSQREWVDAGATQLPPIPSVASLNRKPFVSNRRAAEDSAPMAALKASLARNFGKVVDLFRRWDVNCDGLVSTNEFNDAIGVLQAEGGGLPLEGGLLNALFRQLDADSSGSIDLRELHRALRPYNPPPLSRGRDARDDVISLELPKRRERKDDAAPGSGKDKEAIASVKQQLAVHQSRVIDLFRKWDYDLNANISADELRRALAALSIPIDARALRLLFKQMDADGSGEISFRELNQVLRRQVDFDAGHGERFDAATGTYTTGHTTVQQVPKLPSIALSMTAHVENLTPHVLNGGGGDDHGALAQRRMRHAGQREAASKDAFHAKEKEARLATRSRMVHDVE